MQNVKLKWTHAAPVIIVIMEEIVSTLHKYRWNKHVNKQTNVQVNRHTDKQTELWLFCFFCEFFSTVWFPNMLSCIRKFLLICYVLSFHMLQVGAYASLMLMDV